MPRGLRLTGGRSRGVDVDQGLDVGYPGACVGDNRAAVGVADQDDRSLDGLEVVRDVFGVGGQILQRIRDRARVVTGGLQRGDLATPAGSVRPRPVHEDDGRLLLSGGQTGSVIPACAVSACADWLDASPAATTTATAAGTASSAQKPDGRRRCRTLSSSRRCVSFRIAISLCPLCRSF
jgi:hypothetical protein